MKLISPLFSYRLARATMRGVLALFLLAGAACVQQNAPPEETRLDMDEAEKIFLIQVARPPATNSAPENAAVEQPVLPPPPEAALAPGN